MKADKPWGTNKQPCFLEREKCVTFDNTFKFFRFFFFNLGYFEKKLDIISDINEIP